MEFTEWLKHFDLESRAQMNIDRRDMGLEDDILHLGFLKGLLPIEMLDEVQSQLKMLPIAEFALRNF